MLVSEQAVQAVPTLELTKALSRLAGNRHSDGISSIVSADDRSVIINECHDMMLALRTLRAAHFLTGAKVKALEWKQADTDYWRAISDYGCYGINKMKKGYFEMDGDIYADLEAAKAAAQADYSARILSAIEPAPSPRAQALEEAFREGLEAACGVIDAHSEYDRQLCCDGRECGCYGATIHQSMQHYIRTLSQPVAGGSVAARDVLTERRRQVETEGWTPEHDDQWVNAELSRAAECYAHHSSRPDDQREGMVKAGAWPSFWPWDVEWWKPSDRRRDLVKAGALILAEIERLDRLPASPGASE